MKVLKVIVAVTMLFAAQKASALMDVSAFGGYTTFNMSDVNKQLATYKAGIISSGLPSDATVAKTDISSGYYVGINAGFSVLPFLKVGPRIELLSAGQGKLALTGVGDSITRESTINSSMMLYEAGLSTSFDLPLTGLSVGGGVWWGYGMAGASVMDSMNFTGTAATDAFSGGAFTTEIQAQVAYKIIPMLSVGIDLGYRIASVSQMTANADNTNSGVKKGDALYYYLPAGEPLAPTVFDFSGINIGGKVSFGF